jgi:hypothetical protein
MKAWQVWAQPWWVNLLFLVPILIFFGFRRKSLRLKWLQLLAAAVFASSFGFVEATVVVYLRAAMGLLPGYQGTLADVRSAITAYDQSNSIHDIPQSLLTIEVWREAATILILASVAFLAARRFRERLAIFLWTFAIWDSTYYGGLFATIRWPASLKELDVLFLIPEPWISQVWFPLAVSGLSLIAILLSREGTTGE